MLAAVLLVLVLACAVVRPWGWSEAVIAVPAAVVVIATGAISLGHAMDEAVRLGPVIGFLAAILVLARLCDDEGLFHACGAWLARVTAHRPRRLLGGVFVTASVITAVLSLDATVVLLTPVVFATAAQLGVRPKPHVYACTHLSNTASLLLPVSNLTNLLAFAASGLSFTRFAALTALPWLAAIAVEYAVFRWFFVTDLHAPTHRVDPAQVTEQPLELPVFALVTVSVTLAGFAVTSAMGVNPVWAALAGVVVLGTRTLIRRRTSLTGTAAGSVVGTAVGTVVGVVSGIVRAAALPFLAFVLALGIVVRAVVDNGLADALGHLVPGGAGLLSLLGIAALAAVLANVINNLPAVLVLLPLVTPAGSGAVLAVLLGVNLGPNLTYAGSLATLLWRRIVHAHDTHHTSNPATSHGASQGTSHGTGQATSHGTGVNLGEFTRLGLLAVPASLVLAVLALWASLQLMGG